MMTTNALSRAWMRPKRLIPSMVLVALGAAGASAGKVSAAVDDQYSDWSEPINLGPAVNTTQWGEFGVTVSKTERSLYFMSDMTGGFGGFDIWVSQRANANGPWGPPVNLGPSINTALNETTPHLSVDGRHLYFASTRPGGLGGADLYVSHRHHRHDDFAWEAPENLGSGINSASNEGAPAIFEDREAGTFTVYFFSNRPGGPGGSDIYASTVGPDGTFDAAVLVEELSSPATDIEPAIRRDGLEMLLTSNRPGSMPFPAPNPAISNDLWVSTRETTADVWSAPVNLGPVVNTSFNDGWSALSFDARTLYFSGPAEGTLDIFMSTRTRLE